MVDLAEIQTAYYMVAATGVIVGAIYYIINMRAVIKARDFETCKYLTAHLTSEPAMESYAIVLKGMDWKDPSDFMEKYGYSNPEMFAKWTSWFFIADTLGYQVKNQLVRAETLYDLGAWGFIRMWEMYSGFILSRREGTWGRDYFSGFEYIAKVMLRIKVSRDEGFARAWKEHGGGDFKPEEAKKAFR